MCPVTYLFGPEHHWHHALGLRGLCALINEDGAKLHLSQARVTRTHTCAADHICILRDRDTEHEMIFFFNRKTHHIKTCLISCATENSLSIIVRQRLQRLYKQTH